MSRLCNHKVFNEERKKERKKERDEKENYGLFFNKNNIRRLVENNLRSETPLIGILR